MGRIRKRTRALGSVIPTPGLDSGSDKNFRPFSPVIWMGFGRPEVMNHHPSSVRAWLLDFQKTFRFTGVSELIPAVKTRAFLFSTGHAIVQVHKRDNLFGNHMVAARVDRVPCLNLSFTGAGDAIRIGHTNTLRAG